MLVLTGTGNIGTGVPSEYKLHQNYPNPFNPVTSIKYSVVKDGFVTLKVFDALGRETATLVNEYKKAGTHEVSFSAGQNSSLSSGVYFYGVNVNGFTDIKQMVLIK